MSVIIIKYNAGNIYSMSLALQRLGVQAEISDDVNKIRSANKVIFPGVGEASSAMNHLHKTGLDKIIPALTQPFLGVCLGLQLLCKYSEENKTTCLGVYDEIVRKFPPQDKVPHIGWNSLDISDSLLFKDLNQEEYVYFVHSYYAATGEDTIATTDYIVPFSAALHKDNFYSVQFHPEKSGKVGEKILRNFLEL
jgi:glutamine amidotransferase